MPIIEEIFSFKLLPCIKINTLPINFTKKIENYVDFLILAHDKQIICLAGQDEARVKDEVSMVF